MLRGRIGPVGVRSFLLHPIELGIQLPLRATCDHPTDPNSEGRPSLSAAFESDSLSLASITWIVVQNRPSDANTLNQ